MKEFLKDFNVAECLAKSLLIFLVADAFLMAGLSVSEAFRRIKEMIKEAQDEARRKKYGAGNERVGWR